jgi:hypothetical protein
MSDFRAGDDIAGKVDLFLLDLRSTTSAVLYQCSDKDISETIPDYIEKGMV